MEREAEALTALREAGAMLSIKLKVPWTLATGQQVKMGDGGCATFLGLTPGDHGGVCAVVRDGGDDYVRLLHFSWIERLAFGPCRKCGQIDPKGDYIDTLCFACVTSGRGALP